LEVSPLREAAGFRAQAQISQTPNGITK